MIFLGTSWTLPKRQMQIDNIKLPIPKCQFKIANKKLPIAHCQLPIANCILQVSNCNFKLQMSNEAELHRPAPRLWPTFSRVAPHVANIEINMLFFT